MGGSLLLSEGQHQRLHEGGIGVLGAIVKVQETEGMVIGVSPDSEASHAKFIEKHDLTVELLSDNDKQVCNLYGVWQEKQMAGRRYMGVVRTTFLIDPAGTIVRVWEKVRVNGHAEEVLQACCNTA